jgi:hypothetical protein
VTLLITNYWHPYNNSGAFRWLHLSQYLKLNVLTAKRNKGFYDITMPEGVCKRLYRHGSNLPAILGGLYLSLWSIFIRADKYVYTTPPESMLVGAWINQLLGREVYVDLRDAIDRHTQPHKWLLPLYQWLYRRIKNVCVCMQFYDSSKTVIRHGHDDIKRNGISYNGKIYERLSYHYYCCYLSCGYGKDYSELKFKNYNSSSVVNLRHLGNPIEGKGNLHPECFEFEPQPWIEIAEQMNEFLSR